MVYFIGLLFWCLAMVLVCGIFINGHQRNKESDRAQKEEMAENEKDVNVSI